MLCEAESSSPTAEITIQIRCRNFVIDALLVGRFRYGSLFAKSPAPSNLRDGAKASNPDIPLEYLLFLPSLAKTVSHKGISKLHFGAIHNRSPNDTMATAPTPPSQRAANHSKRPASGRGLGGDAINDSRSRA
jgi:hypothetical protein